MAASLNEPDGSHKKLVDSLSTFNTVIEEMILNVESIFNSEDKTQWHKRVLGGDAVT